MTVTPQPPREVCQAGWQRLVPFPGSFPAEEMAGIDLQGAIERQGDELRLCFRLQGALDQLILPPATPVPSRRDGLWQHTCLEAFWGRCGTAGYWELNASPSGEWNLYRFDRYRQGLQPEPLATPPATTWTFAPAAADRSGRLELELRCPAPEAVPAGALEASLTAVLEHGDGRLSYWALVHPGPEPDFHHRQGFRLRL